MTALAEKIAPASPASPASWLAKTFIQDTAYAIHTKPSSLHRRANEWHHAADADKQKDPAFLVIHLRETAKDLYALADQIEGKMR